MEEVIDRLRKLKDKSIEMNKMLQEAIDTMRELRIKHQNKSNTDKSKML